MDVAIDYHKRMAMDGMAWHGVFFFTENSLAFHKLTICYSFNSRASLTHSLKRTKKAFLIKHSICRFTIFVAIFYSFFYKKQQQ